MKLKTKDLVKILTGKDKGKTGSVEKIYFASNKAIIKSINIAKRHYKSQKNSAKQGIVEKAMPINVSNLGLICQNCQKVTRVKFSIIDGNKIRLCRKCNEALK